MISTRLRPGALLMLMFSVVLFALRAPASAQATPSPAPAALPAPCSTVEVQVTGTIDTKKVKAGETFGFATVGPVDENGVTIPAGTKGVGVIATLDHSKSQGHSGYLVLDARFLELVDGSHVPVTFLPAGDGHSWAFIRAGSSDAGLIGYLPYYIGTAAGVYNVFHHGKDAAVVSGSRMRVVVGDAYYAGTCRVAIDQK